MERTLESISNEAVDFAHRVLGIVSESSRTLAHYFQTTAEGKLRHNRPNLLDLVCPLTSPVVAAEQYLSSLMSGLPEALSLLFGAFGSCREWALACPQPVQAFRKDRWSMPRGVNQTLSTRCPDGHCKNTANLGIETPRRPFPGTLQDHGVSFQEHCGRFVPSEGR